MFRARITLKTSKYVFLNFANFCERMIEHDFNLNNNFRYITHHLRIIIFIHTPDEELVRPKHVVESDIK